MEWGTVVSILLGAAITILSQIVAHRLQRDRDREARQEERERVQRERRDEFQHENLVAVQDALIQWMRAIYAITQEDLVSLRTTGKTADQVDETMDMQELQAAQTIRIHVTRVLDDVIRTEVRELLRIGHVALSARTESEIVDHRRDASRRFDAVNNRIGEELRRLRT